MPNLHSDPPAPPRLLASDPLDYELPETAIAREPLADRSSSRLLVADRHGAISHHRFSDLPTLLPPGVLLVRNVSRVVRARVSMARESGGRVEIFLLEPVAPSHDPAVALAAIGSTTWRCLVGGARKFRREPQLTLRLEDGLTLTATLQSIDAEGATVHFQWDPAERSFADLLERVGDVPLPPYLGREIQPEDAERYQTVFARTNGAVAAPTAGLHFTPDVLARLERNGAKIVDLVLHVGAGTFKPISGSVSRHAMHRERFSVEREALEQLIEACKRRNEDAEGAPIVPVGTTSVRVLESLYWIGVRLVETGTLADSSGEVDLGQWEPYPRLSMSTPLPSPERALRALAQHLDREGKAALDGRTGIMIVPGYRFALCDALITNFHQPRSTLLLLIAAIVGERWRHIYHEALAQGYRFLSYGDSSLLWSRSGSED